MSLQTKTIFLIYNVCAIAEIMQSVQMIRQYLDPLLNGNEGTVFAEINAPGA